MSYTLRATLAAKLTVRETGDAATSPSADAGGNQLVYDAADIGNLILHSGSFPPIGGAVVDLSFTLTGTTKDYDLTAAPMARDISKTVDKTTFKLVTIILQFAKANNAAGVLFGPQGSNGYKLWGSDATPTAIVQRFFPGDQIVLGQVDPAQAGAITLSRPAVAAGAKDVRFTGTIGDSWKALLVFNG